MMTRRVLYNLMGSNNDQRKTAKDVLQALDDTIETGPWDKSVFLGAIGKKLKEIRFRFKNRLRFLDPGFEDSHDEESVAKLEKLPETPAANIPVKTENQAEVFVSLYSADGINIEKWGKLLLALDKQIVTRPVYGQESEIRGIMRAKTVRRNDAYAAFYLDKVDIIPPKDGKAPLDRSGNPLLILKDKSLKLENITRFCHESGVYVFRNNVLSRIGDMNYMDN